MISRLHSTNRLALIAVFWCAIACMPGVTMAQSLRVQQTDEIIIIYDGDTAVLVYNKLSPATPKGIDSVYARSGCLHPVCTPAGRAVTTMFPFDHPHQHGAFSAWVKTEYAGQDVEFWNLAQGSPKNQGRGSKTAHSSAT